MPRTAKELFERSFAEVRELATAVDYKISPEEAARLNTIEAQLLKRESGTAVYTFDPNERPTPEYLRWVLAPEKTSIPLTRALVNQSARRGLVAQFPQLPTEYDQAKVTPIIIDERPRQLKGPIMPTIGMGHSDTVKARETQITNDQEIREEIREKIRSKRTGQAPDFRTGKRVQYGRIILDQLLASTYRYPGDPFLITILEGALSNITRQLWNRNFVISAIGGLAAVTDALTARAIEANPRIVFQKETKSFDDASLNLVKKALMLAMATGDGVFCTSLGETDRSLKLTLGEMGFLSYGILHMFDAAVPLNLNRSQIDSMVDRVTRQGLLSFLR